MGVQGTCERATNARTWDNTGTGTDMDIRTDNKTEGLRWSTPIAAIPVVQALDLAVSATEAVTRSWWGGTRPERLEQCRGRRSPDCGNGVTRRTGLIGCTE